MSVCGELDPMPGGEALAYDGHGVARAIGGDADVDDQGVQGPDEQVIRVHHMTSSRRAGLTPARIMAAATSA